MVEIVVSVAGPATNGKGTGMFGNIVYDAIQLAESESRSALPNAPVREDRKGSGSNWRRSVRRAASVRLHRIADALEPYEPRLVSDPCGGC